MIEAYINTYESEWGIRFLWHRMDWLMRTDVVLLGLLFAYTAVVVIRISRLYHTARCDGNFDRARRRKLAADLKVQAGNLNSIASVAPYLGLVGTCLGILHALFYAGGQADSALAALAPWVAPVLVPAAAAIIVAIAATCACEYARTRLDLLVYALSDRKRLLTGRFTLLPFAPVAAYGLAILVQAFMPFVSVHVPKGFDVGIASARCYSDESDRLLVLHLADSGRVFLNLEEQKEWSTLQSRLSEIYSMRAERILYLSADEGVHLQRVADAIDTVENASEKASSRPLDITIRLITPIAMNARCPEPLRQ